MNVIEKIEQYQDQPVSNTVLKEWALQLAKQYRALEAMCEMYRLRAMIAEGGNKDGRKQTGA